MSQIDSSTFLVNAFNHANKMKDAFLSNDIKELYDFLKSENDSISSFEKFKKETIMVYHDENYNYDLGISNIILERPLVYTYKNQVLQCVILRKTFIKKSEEVISTIIWYYSEDGRNLNYEVFSLEIDDTKLQEWFPFIDLKLFDKK